ncbi:MAG: 50S ribosomal protein L9 [Bacilli bacterium]|nr:50S ribosomal protein L9 [Bacilli bacterium]
MKVIFIKDLKKQGKKGEIKEVKDGYAQNYLIKNGYAVAMTEKNMNTLAKEKAEAKEEDSKNRKEAQVLKEQLENTEFLFKVKTGEGDRVFGSVSPKQIKDELHKKGFKIEKRQLEMVSNLTSLGYHNVTIVLYKDIKAIIKVHVVK